jgi:transposase
MDKLGDKVALSILPGEKKMLKEVYYQGKVKVNLAGECKAGLKEPLWVISDLESERALEIYRARMKLEESFKDLKSLLFLDKVMNKKRDNMEKMVAMVLLAYSIGLLVGEEIRERMYGGGKKRGAVFGVVHSAQAAGATG